MGRHDPNFHTLGYLHDRNKQKPTNQSRDKSGNAHNVYIKQVKTRMNCANCYLVAIDYVYCKMFVNK